MTTWVGGCQRAIPECSWYKGEHGWIPANAGRAPVNELVKGWSIFLGVMATAVLADRQLPCRGAARERARLLCGRRWPQTGSARPAAWCAW